MAAPVLKELLTVATQDMTDDGQLVDAGQGRAEGSIFGVEGTTPRHLQPVTTCCALSPATGEVLEGL